MPSVVAIIFFFFWISYPTRNSARANKREGPRQTQTQTQRRKGRPAGGSPRLLPAPPRGVGVQEVCGTMQLCGETPNKPPWKGAEDSGFFFPKKVHGGQQEHAKLLRIAHRQGRVRMGPSGGGHLARLRASPTVTQTRGAGWGAGGGGGGGRPCTAGEDLAGSVHGGQRGGSPSPETRARHTAQEPHFWVPVQGKRRRCLEERRPSCSRRAGPAPRASGRAGGGPRHWQGRDGPGGCDGERSPAQSSADTVRHRTRRVRRTVGREGGEQQSARPGLGPARSGSRASNTTRSPL